MRAAPLPVELLLLAAVPVSLLSGCNKPNPDRVVKVEQYELPVANSPDRIDQPDEVASDVNIAVDGQPAARTKIESGHAVNVITKTHGNGQLAGKIEAQRIEAGEPDLVAGESAAEILAPLAPPTLAPLPGDSTGSATGQPHGERTLDNEAGEIESTDGQAPRSRQVKPAQGNEQQPITPSESMASATLFRGEIDRISPHRLRVRADADITHLATRREFTVTDRTNILIAARPATLDDLSEGMTVTVTATKVGDQAFAERIEVEPTSV